MEVKIYEKEFRKEFITYQYIVMFIKPLADVYIQKYASIYSFYF